MIGRNVKRILAFVLPALAGFVLFALIGGSACAGATTVSSDEKGQKPELASLDAPDAVGSSVSSYILSADEPFTASTSFVRVVRPPQPVSTSPLSGHAYALIKSCHSVVWHLRTLLRYDLGRHISSHRYADGYYIYHLCRLLI